MLSDQEREQVGQIQASLRQQIDSARADMTITTRERQRKMAKAVLAAKASVQALSERSDGRGQAERSRAYRQLFGLSSDRSGEDRAYRDSIARQDLSATEASAMYEQAVARQDLIAMTALAELAWNHSGDELDGRHWHPILDAYRELPDMATPMNDLVASVNPSKLERLQERMLLEVPQPPDLTGNLDWLASDEESISAASQAGQNWQAG